jgi:hypothetical protein
MAHAAHGKCQPGCGKSFHHDRHRNHQRGAPSFMKSVNVNICVASPKRVALRSTVADFRDNQPKVMP